MTSFRRKDAVQHARVVGKRWDAEETCCFFHHCVLLTSPLWKHLGTLPQAVKREHLFHRSYWSFFEAHQSSPYIEDYGYAYGDLVPRSLNRTIRNILTDQDPHMVSKFISTICGFLRLEQKRSTAYQHQTSQQVEKYNKNESRVLTASCTRTLG